MTRPVKAFIDTKALEHNINFIEKQNPSKKIIAMVKANAYGHGIEIVSKNLSNYDFGVACIEEALQIRKQGIKSDIFCMQGFFDKNDLDLSHSEDLTLVINDWEQLNCLIDYPNKLKFWIKFNTGMNRLGFSFEDLEKIEKFFSINNKIKCLGVMSHFANSSNPKDSFNKIQIEAFKQILLFSNKYNLHTSFSNSGALLNKDLNFGDYIRPGIMLYGISPYKDKTGDELGLEKVMSFKSEITSIYTAEKGSKVGYGGKYICPEITKVGIISVGYGDGYPYKAEKLKVLVDNQEVPVIGAVSMDMIAVNLNNAKFAKKNSPVELWGKHIHVEDIANLTSTIPWQIITGVSQRVPRIEI